LKPKAKLRIAKCKLITQTTPDRKLLRYKTISLKYSSEAGRRVVEHRTF